MQSKHSLFVSFKFALHGLKEAFLKGRNFRIQLGLGVFALLLGLILRLRLVELAILVIIIASVLILELINTSLEAIVDLVSPEVKEEARVAKDVAAAAVFIASFTSLVIGGLLFLPKIF